MGLKDDAGGWRDELVRLDTAVYSAIASTPTPLLDRVMRGVLRAANYSSGWRARLCWQLREVLGVAAPRSTALRLSRSPPPSSTAR